MTSAHRRALRAGRLHRHRHPPAGGADAPAPRPAGDRGEPPPRERPDRAAGDGGREAGRHHGDARQRHHQRRRAADNRAPPGLRLRTRHAAGDAHRRRALSAAGDEGGPAGRSAAWPGRVRARPSRRAEPHVHRRRQLRPSGHGPAGMCGGHRDRACGAVGRRRPEHAIAAPRPCAFRLPRRRDGAGAGWAARRAGGDRAAAPGGAARGADHGGGRLLRDRHLLLARDDGAGRGAAAGAGGAVPGHAGGAGQRDGVLAAFQRQPILPTPSASPDDARSWLQAELARWRGILRETRIEMAD
jgi:hypothetical protein